MISDQLSTRERISCSFDFQPTVLVRAFFFIARYSSDASTSEAEGLSSGLTTNRRRNRSLSSGGMPIVCISSSNDETFKISGSDSSIRALPSLNSHWRTSFLIGGPVQPGKSRISFAMHQLSLKRIILLPAVPKMPGLIQQNNVTASAQIWER